MGKLKNFKGFSDKFKEILTLTEEQVSVIEETEYKLHKEYYWNNLPDNKKSTSAYLDEILKHLNSEQLDLYKIFLEVQKSKKEKRRKEKFDKALEVQSIRLKDLNLNNDQLEIYVKKRLNLTALMLEKMKQAKTQEERDLDVLKQKVYEEEIFPIFNSTQLERYKKIKKIDENKGEKKGKKWRTNHEKQMFKKKYNIDLSQEQAKELFSKDFNHPLKDSEGEFFSDLEMKEKKRNWYEKHLTKEQFKIYLPFYEEQIRYIVESIKKSNDEHDKIQLERTKSYLEYYIENVLSHVVEARKRIEVKLSVKQKTKIEEIRRYYFSQQDINRSKYIEQHNRHYKELKPNALNEFRLRQNIEKINFNIAYLYGYEPAKNLMDSKLQSIVNKENIQLKSVYSELKEFQIESYESTGGNYGAGWVIRIPIKEDEEHLEKIGLLLLEPDVNKNLEKMR